MTTVSVTMAKLSGIRKGLLGTLAEESMPGRARTYWYPPVVQHYFLQVDNLLQTLKVELPLLFGDFHQISTRPDSEGGTPPTGIFTRTALQRLCKEIDHIFELRANSELSPAAPERPAPNRVFITHGRSNDWREVQAYLEKDIQMQTMELAQEANHGMTVIEKLLAGAERCDSAVIVMTGDDIDADGQARARENVMHEIGFFQGKYGRSKVVLLHEDGVSVPTNLSGVVYIPYPKGTVSAGFYVLGRELKALYG